MTDWIEHTTNTCPVDPETVVEVQLYNYTGSFGPARAKWWEPWRNITHYRIITPAKPPEPEMPYTPYALPKWATLSDWIAHDGGECPVSGSALVHVDIPGLNLVPAPAAGFPWKRVKRYCTVDIKPPLEPDLITLRLECLKLAVNDHFYEAGEPDYEKAADRFLRYVLNGSVDKA